MLSFYINMKFLPMSYRRFLYNNNLCNIRIHHKIVSIMDCNLFIDCGFTPLHFTPCSHRYDAPQMLLLIPHNDPVWDHR